MNWPSPTGSFVEVIGRFIFVRKNTTFRAPAIYLHFTKHLNIVPATKVTPQHHQIAPATKSKHCNIITCCPLPLLPNVAFQNHQMLGLPRKVTLQQHQIAPATKSNIATSPNIALATKSDIPTSPKMLRLPRKSDTPTSANLVSVTSEMRVM